MAFISFRGLARDRLGLAVWDADGTGPEPPGRGHTFETAIGPIRAHYYAASRDHGGIDPVSPGAMHGEGPVAGFSHLQEALRRARRTLADLVVRVPLTTPGRDRLGEDWSFSDGVEERSLYPQAPMVLLLDSDPVLRIPASRALLTEDYRDAACFDDVRIALTTDPVVPQSPECHTPRSAPLVKALEADISGRRISLDAELRLLVPEGFSGAGRSRGLFAEFPVAHLRVA